MVHSSPVLPPLDTLETFARAARLGSFSAAAEESGITHGAVSRQVSRLERWMGVRLFAREARGVRLTPEGMRFFARAEEALSLLGNTGERWLPRPSKAVVRLSVTPSVASLWLFQRLPKLEGDELHVELTLEHRLADFGEGTDLAIRCGKGPWAGVRALPLWQEKSFPIAAPVLAERLGQRSDALSLLDLPILHDSNIEGWRRWLAREGIDYIPRGQDRRFEDYNLVIDACAQGLGIALARPPLSDAALTAGRIVKVSERTLDNNVAFHLIRPDDALRSPAIEFAGRFLREAGHDEETIAAFIAPGRAKT
ncbi:LysR family transcriptional regulator (plasmid) [Rhizobium sp. Pop5]|uniref:LysR family transcriptional regulator n=2 Tax=Rhizobium sp. Pop5 TaxID=1223565 RepID=UPI002157721B|nr:LysR family transcriptional regulator [Rhizobium sp. Pop5]UVD60008.1 LysR family transcriptional regulator [Rhizobium sp. Pop5]